MNADSNTGRHIHLWPSPAYPTPWTWFKGDQMSHQMIVFVETSWSNGRDSIIRSSLLLVPPRRFFFKSSVQVNRHDRVINRIDSSKTDSSHGITNGPWFANPNSSSALAKRLLMMGWFRCVAHTTNLLQLLPTWTATYPDGTSDGTQRLTEELRALLRHCRSICLSFTMCRILLHFPIPPAIFFRVACSKRKCKKMERKDWCWWIWDFLEGRCLYTKDSNTMPSVTQDNYDTAILVLIFGGLRQMQHDLLGRVVVCVMEYG